MIKIDNKINCCGCNACSDICPKTAISFKTDIEGFWYPEVAMDKCIDCHLCEKVCPILNKKEWHANGGFEKPKAFAAIHKNIEVRFDSTSGGIFTALAEEIFKHGGFVGGAVYNKDFSVSHFLTNCKSDLPKLRSSKYLQSHLDGFYIAVKEALKTNKPVLVCGSPCQMAALYRFLHKPYENLIVVDFICRGIASPLFFRKFLDYLEKKHNSQITFYKAKSKELGWRKLSTRIEFANKDIEYIQGAENPWLKMQYKIPEICRPSCFECPFKGYPRTSDITIGDLWTKSDIIPQKLDNDLGTSVVLINTEKGFEFFKKCEQKITYKEFLFEKVIEGNCHLVKSVSHSQYKRDDFFKDLNDSFEGCIVKYLPNFHNSKSGFKTKLKNLARFLLDVHAAAGWNLHIWCKNLFYNLLSRKIEGSILRREYFILNKYCILNLHRNAKIILKAPFILGYKRIKGSRIETRLLIEDGGRLEIKYGKYTVYYGADIEVFKEGILEIGGDADVNIGLNLICANHISIGRYTGGGRNVTIRDNNGNHYISLRGYKTGHPVIIKEHVWLTESCTVMAGSVIESGAIISAHSVVSGHIPSSSIVSGNPAKVVEKNIYWKA